MYRARLKNGPQVPWMWGEKIAYSCLQQAEECNFFSSHSRNLGPVFLAELCSSSEDRKGFEVRGTSYWSSTDFVRKAPWWLLAVARKLSMVTKLDEPPGIQFAQIGFEVTSGGWFGQPGLGVSSGGHFRQLFSEAPHDGQFRQRDFGVNFWWESCLNLTFNKRAVLFHQTIKW